MSNSLAIAAVSATLRNLLEKRLNALPATDPSSDAMLAGTVVTTRAPDEAQQRTDAKQLNLFLYQTTLDGAVRNSGTQLPLTLHYLLTPYVRDDQQDTSHLSDRLLGRAMSILHDHPLLGAGEIELALPDNDLHRQVERVRIVPEALTTEELSKLWACFQAKFRVSASYQVSVVLIDSLRSPASALPVLSRGPDDRGPVAVAGRMPTLFDAKPPDPQRALRLGEELTLIGEALDQVGAEVRIHGLHLPAPILLAPLPGSSGTALRVLAPAAAGDANALSRWAAGVCTAALLVQAPGRPSFASNEVPFAFAPSISVAPLNAASGDVTLTVTVSPRLREAQRVLLLLGDRQLAPQTISTPADATKPSTTTFLVRSLTAGSYPVRLRVDGVDSIPMVRAAGPPPKLEFDPAQTVTVV
jgi:hypothetical protein